MKIKKINLKKSKLLKLNFINTKLYKKISINFITINEIIIRLKQSLQIIYKYHTNNKRILFIGFSNTINNKFKYILKNTNHILLPNFIWPNGVLTNKNSCLEYILKNQTSINHQLSKTLFKFHKKVDLIVLLDSFSEENILNESYTSKIPTISLNDSLNIFDLRTSYKILCNLNFSRKNFKNNFFYSILNSLFKKAKLVKKFELSSEDKKKNLMSVIHNKKPPILKQKSFFNKFKKSRYY
jgi:ribosomal protein S2